jgi:poly(A) polymerase
MPSWSRLFDEHNDGVDALTAGLEDLESDAPASMIWRLLASLDEYVVQTGDSVTNGVLQAVMFAAFVPELAAEPRQGLDKAIERLMAPAGTAMGIARRDRELARQVLMAHRRMVDTRPRKKRRSSLAQRQYFHDALTFLGIWVGARPEDGSELTVWQEMVEARHSAPSESDDAGGRPRRRRRRRGGRKSKKNGDGGERASSSDAASDGSASN